MFNRIRQQVFENIGIKITSLILALAVYAHVYSQQDHVSVFQIPVAVEGMPPALTYRGELPTGVRIRVRAKGGDLFKLRTQGPRALINLSQTRPGVLQRPITSADVMIPSDVEAKVEGLIEPVILSLVIEPVERATLPVEVRFTGTPAEGRMPLGPPAVWPETLSVSGPASVVSKLQAIPTEEVSLEGRSETVRETVRLRLPEGIQSRVERVMIRLPLVPVLHRDFGRLPVSLPPGLRGNWAARPESVRVRLVGPQVLLEAVNRASLHPRASPAPPFEDEESVVVELALPLNLRERVMIESIDPPTVVLLKARR